MDLGSLAPGSQDGDSRPHSLKPTLPRASPLIASVAFAHRVTYFVNGVRLSCKPSECDSKAVEAVGQPSAIPEERPLVYKGERES